MPKTQYVIGMGMNIRIEVLEEMRLSGLNSDSGLRR